MVKDFKNIADARKTLTPPLKFGDQDQIDAADFVALYHTAAECLSIEGYSRGECQACKGVGEIDCQCDCGDDHTRQCKKCDGKGSLAVDGKWLATLDRKGLEGVVDELRALGYAGAEAA